MTWHRLSPGVRTLVVVVGIEESRSLSPGSARTGVLCTGA